MKLHDGEVEIDAQLVGRLLNDQFPRLAGLPITEVHSTGTVNAIYRLGDHLYVRLPRLRKWANGLDREWHWLPRLSSHLSLRIPEPIEKGRPTHSYPLVWAIYWWIDGQPYADALVDDERQAARDLARFVAELRRVDSDGATRSGRRPLGELDADTRAAITSAAGVIDSDAAIAAWSVFGPAGREAFRAALAVDGGTWERARGIALHQAALIIPYYAKTNRGFVALARRTIEEVLAGSGS
jgi:aminoglycoside phosphotransferase (APT) family kinase protein